MSDEQLPKHGLWFFGVILGLAIKEALTHVAPHIFNPAFIDRKALWSEMGRLALFLFLAIRFYLGAVKYFQRAYGDTESGKYKEKSFGMDFLFGFVHFLFFFGFALSVDVHAVPKHWFPTLLAIILSYDLIWYWFSKDTRKLIGMWTLINSATLLLSALIYIGARDYFNDAMIAEQIAYVPVVVASAVDMGELTKDKEIFSDWLRRFLPDIQ